MPEDNDVMIKLQLFALPLAMLSATAGGLVPPQKAAVRKPLQIQALWKKGEDVAVKALGKPEKPNPKNPGVLVYKNIKGFRLVKLVFRKSEGLVSFRGILDQGIAPEDALALVGLKPASKGVTSEFDISELHENTPWGSRTTLVEYTQDETIKKLLPPATGHATWVLVTEASLSEVESSKSPG
jgi:hypothetical protein